MKKITSLFYFLISIQLTFAQDTCATAPTIGVGTHTVAAVNGTQIPTPDCIGSGNPTAGEWYKYIPTQAYTVTVTTDLAANICKDTRLHIYGGACSSLSCIAGDDDSGVLQCNSGNTNSYLSTVTFNVTAGTTYYIAFDNRWSSAGFDFEIIETPIVVLPINFTQQSISSSSTICCVVDMNGDYLDDIVTVGATSMTILHQQTSGGFVSSTISLPGLTTTPSWSITAGDYDRNGFNDIVFGGSSRLTIVKANATGTNYTEVSYPQNIFTQRANFVDINNDGNLDLWACHDVAAPVGDPQRINLLYKNNGNGTFTESGAIAGLNDGSQSWSTAIEDFDNDGDMDFLLSNISDTNKFFINNGDGTFTDIYTTTGIAAQVGSWEVQAADFNNDGWVDFFWQNGKEIYLNNGDLTFTGYDLSFSEGGIGDLNNDGFLDVQYGGNVYYNVPNANNWIKVNLQGVASNRNGIGTRVEIYGAWGKQIREIRSGHGFSHQSTMNAHFGIGTETAITQVMIHWPSGTVDVINNPSSNQALTVVEGSSPLSVVNSELNKIIIYPNPTSKTLSISNASQLSIKNISIYTTQGKIVKNIIYENDTISVEDLAEGLYILTIQTEEGTKYSESFLKKN
ncbi:FG-GAP-like repeat-containing protein [uncultured Flavobacterium sp.]|uniref:FG-GAP-like repeat-containing protein n=1 Tax=uncultured Flavobacterium sp. TaxID=165435 RepID=UPI0030EDB2FE